MHAGVPSDAMRVWAMLLPMKVKFFAWLLGRGRLNTRAYLHHRNIRALEDSWCVHCPGVLETDVHIFVGCHKAHAVWVRLGISMHCDLVQRPWDIVVGVTLPDVLRVDFFLLLLWHLWKARNAMIFDQLDLPWISTLGRDGTRNIGWNYRFGEIGSQHVILPLPQLFPLNPLPCVSFLVCRESIGLYKSFQLMVSGDPRPILLEKKKSHN